MHYVRYKINRARYPCQIIDRHKRIRLRIKARGSTARGQTASYFYIISTWPRRYCVPSLSLPPSFLLSSVPDRYFLPKPVVFLETAADLFPEPAFPCSLLNRRCIMFLGGEPRYTYIRSVAPSPTPAFLPSPPFPRSVHPIVCRCISDPSDSYPN